MTYKWHIIEFSIPPLRVKIDFEKSRPVMRRSGREMEKRQQRFVIKFFWLGEYGRAKYIKNYVPPLEVTPTLRTRSSTGLLALNQVT
jgi:hypothetical protein